ncbi:flagellar hook-length control protein FliK [Aquisalimonas lutea]|uniref:flagellar hook-length control protein FliK n=1 Tax=Aquisalimonas lutea TaxID=1327750 RepID=UPI0025B5AB45|nr:flagellar hook-length control protein FliK [Aquisalimonas lutea]MDN3518285.1 flagellar hook-length control protein FliK [Aquisalimonas lutea]
MQGLQLIESALRNMEGGKLDPSRPDAPENRAFLEALLETDALKDSGLTLEDLEAWLASQGGKGLPLGGQELPLADGQRPVAEGLARGQNDDALPADAAARRALRGGAEQQDEAVLYDLLAMGGMGGQNGKGPMAGSPGSDDGAGEQTLMQLVARARQLQSQQALAEAQGRGSPGGETSQADAGRAVQAHFQQTLHNAMPQPTGTPTYTVPQSMDQSGWGQALGERVVMMANQNVQQARVQINPPELGPLDVRIRTADDKTSIVFQAQSAVTREALDAELPRLRMMLSDNGIEDAEVSVDHGDASPENQDGERREGFARGDTQDGRSGSDGLSGPGGDAGGDGEARSLIDHYA